MPLLLDSDLYNSQFRVYVQGDLLGTNSVIPFPARKQTHKKLNRIQKHHWLESMLRILVIY